MKKLMNAPEDYVTDMLKGIYSAYPDKLKPVGSDLRELVTANKKQGKVGLVTGGGSGHLPLFLGYVGDGMLDGCAVGEVFQSPTADQMANVTREVDSGAGVLYIFGNYNGDIFNFKMAEETVSFEDDIKIEKVIGTDDIATDDHSKRRGVAGIFFVYKCAGAAADKGLDLAGVKRIACLANDSVRTMGIALSACILPRVGKPGFSIDDNMMEIGMGIHGEPGVSTQELKSADEIVNQIMGHLLSDLECKQGDEVAVLVNGLGSTPLDELYILMNRVSEVLGEKGISLYRSYIGEYVTSMDMAGASISLLLLNDELKPLLDAPANTPFFKQF